MTTDARGNLRFEVKRGVPTVSATGPLMPRDLEVLRAHPDCELSLTYMSGWHGGTLDFLRELPGLKRLFLLVLDKLDVSPITSLANLESLTVHCTTVGRVDFGAMRHLRTCRLRWQPGFKSVFDATAAEVLELDAYSGHDLIPFQRLTSLRALQLMASRLWTTAGIAALSQVRSLDLRGCRRLEDLVGVDSLQGLEELNVEGCSKLTSLAPAFRAARLRRLLAGDCPRLATLAGIERLGALEEVHLVGTARVGDDDLAPLLKLPSLRRLCVHWRKSYSPPISEFAELIPH